ncbi:RNA-dependent RNA polymerase [Bacopa monnieri virus 2]|uniref:RNA-directed RNA polymerase n=1 Tax=Bacopa monnieri virus 2 TaxID=2813288 RepID=A0AAD2KPQ8_9RHAB|nr:RNA-dependent RNA polymerase [Bacopa monnieri virus 2]DAF42454.1 TPA_asm: RNA-dependent RNA polymerase [Bacopa monnieri virus 2]
MEDTHWIASMSWAGDDPDDMVQGQDENPKHEVPGSYHCKSALRDHESNMKLFLYKKSYLKLKDLTGSDPYTEEVCLLLPDMWRCFFIKSHGLNRVEDRLAAIHHATPTPAFGNWADHVVGPVMRGDIIRNTLMQEKAIWGSSTDWVEKIDHSVYTKLMVPFESLLKLICFLKASLIVLNYSPVLERPSIGVTLPGVCTSSQEGVYIITYNEYLKVHICGQAVRVSTPVYDQIMQKDLYLTLCDKINERFNVALGASYIELLSRLRDTGNIDERHMSGIVLRIIRWGDDLLYRHKNRAFDLIGKYEAYCVSAILMYDDNNIWACDEFQNNLLLDDEDNAQDLYPHARELCNELNLLTPVGLAEVHGLWRIWGHPIIDLVGGLKKMETTCLKQQSIDKKETKTGERTFKFLFATNYYKKHQHYPLSNATPTHLVDLYLEHMTERDIESIARNKVEDNKRGYIVQCIINNRPINNRDSGYVHADWDDIIFYQNFQTPHSINLATMIKDKAISQTRAELISSVMTRNSVFDSTKRRGVLKWLSEQTLRLKDYLKTVDHEGLAEDDRIIGLYPKERELKTKARFFSLMSYNMRMFITSTEEIIGKYLLPYFPMITMSDTLLSMIIRLYNMTTTIGATDSSVTYSMNIDFSKWNQNMREKTNERIFGNIDRIVGFRRLISRTHEIFRTSYLYLCSGEYIPAIVRGCLTALSPFSRIGDESGKEGLRQKGWTITTVCDIVSLAFIHGVAIELIGGGDNQVLTVTIRSSKKQLSLTYNQQRRIIRERMERFRNALAKKMEKRGLPLKLEETWISHRLLMYNKIMYHDGVPLPGRLKVISRLFSNSNEGIACLGNICSTLGTGYQALSAKDYDPALTWVLSRVFTLINLAQYHLFCPMNGMSRLDKAMLESKKNMREGTGMFGGPLVRTIKPRTKIQEDFSGDRSLDVPDLYIICLYYHKILGGPGIGSPFSYIMKGFPDPLSESLCFNYMVLKGGSYMSKASRTKIENVTRVESSKIQHWEHLLEDPVSVNHNAPSHGIAALREQSSEVIKKAKINNRQFKELITLGDKDYLRKLSQNLCSPDVLEPRLLHDIVGSTLPGYVNTILSKVDQSSTISKLSTTGGIINSIYESEMKYYIYLADKIHVGKGHVITECPTRDAEYLRNLTWKKTIVGVTTPHPAAYLTPSNHGSDSITCDQNYISVLVKRYYPIYEMRRGDFRPYFGSYTKEKFKGSILASAYGDEDLLKRALKIQRLLGWRYKKDTYMYKVIQGILSCVTDADPSKFLPTVEEITGDVEHRYHDMATKHGGIPSNLIKYYTHTSCSTSTFINHSKGARNESLHFQAAIIYCSMMSIMAESRNKKTSQLYHYHECCKTCIQPIVQPEDVDRLPQDVSLISCKTNELMFVEEKDIPVHFHNVVAFHNQQAKREKATGRGVDPTMIMFTEKRERASWFLLAVSTLILSSGVKESAIDLIVAEMSADEIICAIASFVYIQLVKKKKALNNYDVCDVNDVFLENRQVLSKLLYSTAIRSLVMEEGIVEGKKGEGELNVISCLISDANETFCRLLEDAVCKYQDPHFKVCKSLLLVAKTPTTKTCPLCVEFIYSSTWSDTPRHCAVHPAIDEVTVFHLYSLDKLSRFAGPPLSLHQKRKRTGDLFSYIKLARDNKSSRLIRSRLSGFLFRRIPYEDDIREYICGGWSNVRVTTDDTGESDRLNIRYCAAREPPYCPYLPPIESNVLAFVQGTIAILSMASKSGSEVKLAIEVDTTKTSAQMYSKSICMISDVLEHLDDIHVILSFLLDDVKDLEHNNNKLISDICYNVRISGRRSSKLTLIEKGETHMNTPGVIMKNDVTIILNARAIAYTLSDKDMYIYTTSSGAYTQLLELEETLEVSGISAKVDILQPLMTSSYPSPVVLRVTEINPYRRVEGHYISDSKVREVLDAYCPRTDTRITNMIVETSSPSRTLSLVHGVYKKYVSIGSGIVSESTYNRAITCLSTGLYEFALESERTETMNWRCIMIIKIILALRVSTSEDEFNALKYYCGVVGASFKRGTCRRILLHRRVPKSRELGGLINWTRGSFASDLPSIVEEMKEWVSISWKSGHALARYIDI